MTNEEFKLGAPVQATLYDGTVKDGVLKGIYQDQQGKTQVTVEYEQPVESTFDLDKVTLK